MPLMDLIGIGGVGDVSLFQLFLRGYCITTSMGWNNSLLHLQAEDFAVPLTLLVSRKTRSEDRTTLFFLD